MTCPSGAICPSPSVAPVGYIERTPPAGGLMTGRGTVVPPIVRDAALSREPGTIVDAHPSSPDSWNLTIARDGQLRNLDVRNDGLILSNVKDPIEDQIRNLPPTVRDSVNSTFPGAVIYEMDEGSTDGQAAYRLEMLHNGQQLFAIVAPNGTIINQGALPPSGR